MVDIYARILKPLDDDEYVVLVSALPCDVGENLDVYPHLSCAVHSLAQARLRRRALAAELRIDVERRGLMVREVKFRG
jgi:hypothetical protein